jgi:hypothetical protein
MSNDAHPPATRSIAVAIVLIAWAFPSFAEPPKGSGNPKVEAASTGKDRRAGKAETGRGARAAAQDGARSS